LPQDQVLRFLWIAFLLQDGIIPRIFEGFH